jgi:hypothetical protein
MTDTGLTEEEILILQLGPMTEREAQGGSSDEDEIDRRLQRWGEERYRQILLKVKRDEVARASNWFT